MMNLCPLLFEVGGLKFKMKYHILHDLRTSNPFQKKSSAHFEDLRKLELLTKFDINVTYHLKRVHDLSIQDIVHYFSQK